MDRVVHKAQSFGEAESWDIQQQVSMTPNERIQAAKVLKARVYGERTRDVRECHRKS